MSHRSLFTAGVSASVAALFATTALAGDEALFYQPSPTQEAPFVTGGTAAIDRALTQIIPSPYRVLLDDSVPSSMVLIWGRGDNWMDVLNRALAPVGLVAKPDWSRNSVTVAWRAAPAVPVAQQAVSPRQPDYSGEMVFKQMKGSSLAPSRNAPVQVAAVVARPAVVQPSSRYEAAPTPVAREEGVVVHYVRRGETLGMVGARYGVPAWRIAADNGITNPNLVRVGQALTIKRPGTTVMASKAVPSPAPQPVATPPLLRVAATVPAPRHTSAASAVNLPPVPAAAIRSASAPQKPVLAVSAASPSAGTEMLRLLGANPRLDDKVIAAARRTVARDGEIILRGHSSALTVEERAAVANENARLVREQLISRGIPADSVRVVSNSGRVMTPTRVDVVLIGSKEKVDV